MRGFMKSNMIGNSFIPASMIPKNPLSRYNYTNNNSIFNNNNNYFSNKNGTTPIAQFHSTKRRKRFPTITLWNTNQKTWTTTINAPPIRITNYDIDNWITFKTQKLEIGRLYLLQTINEEWVPMWSLKEGFLLNNIAYISYKEVDIKTLANPSWIKRNKVPISAIKLILHRFDMMYDDFIFKINTQQQRQQRQQRKQRIQSNTVIGHPFFIGKSTKPKESELLTIWQVS